MDSAIAGDLCRKCSSFIPTTEAVPPGTSQAVNTLYDPVSIDGPKAVSACTGSSSWKQTRPKTWIEGHSAWPGTWCFGESFRADEKRRWGRDNCIL